MSQNRVNVKLELQTHRKFTMVKFLIVVAAIAAIGAAWVHTRSQRRAKQETLARAAESEVSRLLQGHHYRQASEVLGTFRQRGLDIHRVDEVAADIDAAALAHRQGVVDKVKESLAERDWRAVNSCLDEAERELQGIVALGDFAPLREQAAAGPSLDAMERSEILFQKGDLEGAIAAAGEAAKLRTSRSAVPEWEQVLRGKIGGRLRVDASPASATIAINGQNGAKAGEITWGLPEGRATLEVAADGCWAWKGEVDVRYPDVVVKRVDLMPFVPDPVWALHITRGRPAQRVVVAYYERNRPQGDLTAVLKALVQPDAATAATDRSLDAALKAADAEFAAALARQDGPAALDVLGAFLAAYPGAADRVWETYGDRISTLVRRLERGCAGCLGRGTKPCQRCGGTGRLDTLARCSRCGRDGADAGKLLCIQCKGTSKMRCRICNGKGEVKKRKEKERCGQCRGTGHEPCNNRSCVDGKVTCQACQGSGKVPSTVACQECSAGSLRCDTCEGTGDRERVPLYERERQERDLYAVIAERG